jgi:tol-pal system protein YbgF
MTLTSRMLAAAAFSFALIATPAFSQTVLAPPPADPQAIGLVDRIDALEAELRKQTAENERLHFELQKSQADVARLNKELETYRPPVPADPAPPPAPQSNITGSLGTLSSTDVAASAPAPVDPASAFKDAYDYIARTDFAGAEKAFRAFLAAYPTSEFSPEARYWLGRSLLAQGSSAAAAKELLNVVQTAGKSTKAPDAYLYLGEAFKQMGQVDQACAVFRDVPVKYPGAAAAIKSKALTNAKTCPA